MAGCFGNSVFDRCMEQQLFQYLDYLDDMNCPKCNAEFNEDDFDWDEDTFVCPECGEQFELDEHDTSEKPS